MTEGTRFALKTQRQQPQTHNMPIQYFDLPLSSLRNVGQQPAIDSDLVSHFKDPANWPCPITREFQIWAMNVGPMPLRMRLDSYPWVDPERNKVRFKNSYFGIRRNEKEPHLEERQRDWLMYSVKQNTVCCFYCTIFGEPGPTSIKYQNCKFAHSSGTNAYHSMRALLEKHDTSSLHVSAREACEFLRNSLIGSSRPLQQTCSSGQNHVKTLNFVINDQLKTIGVEFFCDIRQFYAYFGASFKRWAVLTKHSDLAGKTACTTEWNGQTAYLAPFVDDYDSLYEALVELYESVAMDRAAIQRLVITLRNPEFSASVLLWNDILQLINPVSEMFQNRHLEASSTRQILTNLQLAINALLSPAYFQQICQDAKKKIHLCPWRWQVQTATKETR